MSKPKLFPYSAVFIDLTTPEYFKLLTKFAKPHNRFKLQQTLEDVFIKNPDNEKLLPCLSVRSGFDLFLQAANFPVGSEVIMTGINIPDMMTIVTCHGYVAVPVNVDIDYLAPKIEDIEKVITEKTKAIMVSYVYGARYNIDDIIKLCKKHNIYVVEDLAESFYSTEYNGHPEADVSLFSFGSIKINTAMSGCLNVVRNDDVLYRKMKHIQDQYPMQQTSAYFKKILKMSFPALLLNQRIWNYGIRTVGIVTGFDVREYAVSLLRGFPTDGDFLSKFRFQVCTPLLANLASRMQLFNNEEFAAYVKRVTKVQEDLIKSGVKVPGHAAEGRSFWLFPIVVPDVKVCQKLFDEVGVDAYLGATQLKVIESPTGSKFKDMSETKEFFEKFLYLPIHKNLTEAQFEDLCKRVVEVLNKYKALHQKPKL